MALTPDTELVFASWLAKSAVNSDPELELTAEDREVFSRNAVRAAYYACYHAALEWATWRGYEWPDTWGSHDGLWDCWYKKQPETQRIRNRGNALKGKRHTADYDVDAPFALDALVVVKEADGSMAILKADQDRVHALPSKDRKITWDKTAHPKPGRRRGGKGGTTAKR